MADLLQSEDRLRRVSSRQNARVKELRDAGYVIENRTTRVGKQVHGAFRLVACPGETDEVIGGR